MTPAELTDLEERVVAQPALYVRSLCGEVRRLTAELEAAQADTARLDWMAMHGHPIEMQGFADTVGMHYGLMAAPEVPLREAIDAARAAA